MVRFPKFGLGEGRDWGGGGGADYDIGNMSKTTLLLGSLSFIFSLEALLPLLKQRANLAL